MIALWRPLFVLFAVLAAAGGPRHPRGTLLQMLGDPAWASSHALVLAGFAAFLAGLIAFRGRGTALPARTSRWAALAILGTTLQVVQLVLHTAASLDHANLAAGRATPLLTTAIWCGVIFSPIFAATLIGLIVAGLRDRTLGSVWTAWAGLLGALLFAIAPALELARVTRPEQFSAALIGIALWAIAAGLWHAPRAAHAADTADRADEAGGLS